MIATQPADVHQTMDPWCYSELNQILSTNCSYGADSGKCDYYSVVCALSWSADIGPNT